MTIPEFPELTERQANTIISIMVICFIILLPVIMISLDLAHRQFYAYHKQECLSHKGTWKEEMNNDKNFSWSCNYSGIIND